MYEPNPQDPEFGSELRRRETPEHHRQRRRRGIAAALLGIVLGAMMMFVGVGAIRTGELIVSRGELPITGEEACFMAVFLMALSMWLLWRFLTNRQ